MELLQSTPALVLYLSAAGLTALGRGKPLPAFLGGLCWAVGTVAALVDGVPLEEPLCAVLVLLLLSAGVWRRPHEL